jgi:sterol 3beta-glucosyltransferase
MRIAVLTIGSRGDIEPFLALAAALRDAGHDVRIGAPPNFAALAERHEIAFEPMGLDTLALLREAQARKIVGSGNLLGAFRGSTFQRLQDRQTRITRDAWRIAQGMDAVVYKAGLAAGSTVAEKLGIPAIAVALQPMSPTRAFAPPLSGITLGAGGLGNRVLGKVFASAIWSIGRPGVRDLRRELDLPPLPYFGLRTQDEPTTLHAFSPLVLAKPDDWPAHFHVTGFISSHAAPWTPPDTLVRFLEAGPPPLYIGFGSMTHPDPKRLLATMLGGVRRVGHRAILLAGWEDYGRDLELPDFVHLISEAPHDWLFPRMAGVAHHGGAGTTGSALRSGVPSLVLPFNYDQPFWGRRVFELGVGPAPIPLRELTEDRLADGLSRLLHDAEMRRRAAELGHRMRAEDGCARAVEHIQAMIERSMARGAPRPGAVTAARPRALP